MKCVVRDRRDVGLQRYINTSDIGMRKLRYSIWEFGKVWLGKDQVNRESRINYVGGNEKKIGFQKH